MCFALLTRLFVTDMKVVLDFNFEMLAYTTSELVELACEMLEHTAIG